MKTTYTPPQFDDVLDCTFDVEAMFAEPIVSPDKSALDRELTLAFGEKKGSNAVKDETITIKQLIDQKFVYRIGDTDGAYLLQGSCPSRCRSAENMAANHIMAFDIENGDTRQMIVERITRAGLMGVTYPTHSHLTTTTKIGEKDFAKYRQKLEQLTDIGVARAYLREHKHYTEALLSSIKSVDRDGIHYVATHDPMPRYRIILFLNKPFAFDRAGRTDQWKHSYLDVAAMIGLTIDQSCSDPGRLMYLPSKPLTAKKLRRARLIEGELLDLDTVPRLTDDTVRPGEFAPETDPLDAALSRSNLPLPPLSEIKEALGFISPDTRKNWLAVGMAIKLAYGDTPEAFAVWNDWSAQGHGHKGLADQKYQWSTFKRTAGTVVTIATVIMWAQEGGWQRAKAGTPFDLFGDEAKTQTPVLTRDMVPKVIADFAFDQAERLGVEPAMVLIPALTVCAAAITDDVKIQPLEFDHTWIVPPRLWTAVIGESGIGKTPALNSATGPLQDVQTKWGTEDAKALARYEVQMKRHAKGNSMEGEPIKPKMRRTIVNDFTTEALAIVLRDNERGVLAVCDELVGLIGSFDAYRSRSTGKDRAAALELWNGGPRMVDRARAGASVSVPNWGVSIVGGIQPDKLRDIAPDLTDDGFLQRFQPYFGRRVGRKQDRVPNAEALAAYNTLMQRLVDIPKDATRKPVTLSPEAHVYRKEVDDLAFALSGLPTTSGALKAHLEKWPGMFARLLLTIHVIERRAEKPGAHVEIGESARKARDLMLKFFLPNARAFYGQFFKRLDVTGNRARWVAGHILARKLSSITARDIKQAYRELAEDDDGITQTMADLARANWVGLPDTRRAGSTRWTVNPAVHVQFAERAAIEQEERERVQREIAEHQKTVNRTLK